MMGISSKVYEPYHISVSGQQTSDGWLHFVLYRSVSSAPDGSLFCDWTVCLDGQDVLTGVNDPPKDEHDTEEIIDILNTQLNLGLY